MFSKILNFFGFTTNSWPDKLDKKKVFANLLVIKHRSYDLAISFTTFDEYESEALKFATPSIKQLDFLGGIPLGFSYEFIASYPDVVLWWSKMDDDRQESILVNFNENDLLDNSEKIKIKYLIKIIEEYKNDGNIPECI